MLKTRIHVDLPSHRLEATDGPRWLSRLFGRAPEPSAGRERVEASSEGLLRGVVKAAAGVGLTNAIALMVDDRLVWLDPGETPDDLARMEAEAERSGALDRGGDTLHVVLHDVREAQVVIVDVEVHREVLLRQPELRCDILVHPAVLTARRGDSHEAYLRRVRSVATPGVIEPLLSRLEQWVRPLALSFERAFPGSRAVVEAPRLELHWPDAETVAGLPDLPFGDEVLEAEYRPHPERQGLRTYGLPLYDLYYDDPYAPLADVVMIRQLVDTPALHRPDVHVVDARGEALLTGPDVPTYPFHRLPGWDRVALRGDRLVAAG